LADEQEECSENMFMLISGTISLPSKQAAAAVLSSVRINLVRLLPAQFVIMTFGFGSPKHAINLFAEEFPASAQVKLNV
jgi:hypothetical protein